MTDTAVGPTRIKSAQRPIQRNARHAETKTLAYETLQAVVDAQTAYHGQHNAYAASLDALQPDYLSAAQAAPGHGLTLTMTGSDYGFSAVVVCLDPPLSWTADESGKIKTE